MNIGAMDRRIKFLEDSDAQDAEGYVTTTSMLIAEVWAQVIPLRGAELFEAQQTVAQADTRFRVRYRPDVGPTAKIEYDGRLYNIESVIELGRREALEIMARARAE